jgi:hypothetical protein
MAIVYMDQWVYVNLLRCQKGLYPEYSKYSKVYQKLIDSSDNGTNKFPFSIAHLHETIKRTKLSSRKELYKFIFDLSKFNTIRPWVQIIDLEIRNAILKSIGSQPVDLTNYVFGNELGHCFGSKAELSSVDPAKKVPEEIRKKVFSVYRNSDIMSSVLCEDKMLEYVKGLIQEDIELAEKLENMRKKEYSHPDKKMRKNISDARFFIEIIQDDFVKAILDFKLDAKKYIKNIFSSKESAIRFLKSIPTGYVFHVLNDTRNQNTSRPIEPNDLWDLGALAIAVPYCDVVVTEREWARILNQNRIGELYNTKITHKLEDLLTI